MGLVTMFTCLPCGKLIEQSNTFDQRRGETVSEYIQRFRTVRNRCYSVRLSEKEAVELAVAGLSAPLRDVTFQAEYNSLAHMVQKLTAYEQRHPELYQDKYKRVALIETDEDEDSAGDQEVAVAEWTRGAKPVSCKWVKQPGPVKGLSHQMKILKSEKKKIDITDQGGVLMDSATPKSARVQRPEMWKKPRERVHMHVWEARHVTAVKIQQTLETEARPPKKVAASRRKRCGDIG
ncbi:hypothetical protein QYE76_027137 [Lolium multiflorum]|uniref:Retrotransposon gag domain-containing protein n=1 Tax=Lolium multiflorum TaxID=4521 RepID=A0AAD8VCN0_LOLMU|nr:hypothetical protein QYE76_027137 [Lolium multiflorum]